MGEYAHPVEILVLGFGTGLGPILFARDLHLVSLWFYMSARLWQVRCNQQHAGAGQQGPLPDAGSPVQNARRLSMRIRAPTFRGACTTCCRSGQVGRVFRPRHVVSPVTRAHGVLPIPPLSPAGAEFHDHHHMAFMGNYGTSFRWCDWLFGTDNYYQAWRKAGKKMSGRPVRDPYTVDSTTGVDTAVAPTKAKAT